MILSELAKTLNHSRAEMHWHLETQCLIAHRSVYGSRNGFTFLFRILAVFLDRGKNTTSMRTIGGPANHSDCFSEFSIVFL